MILARCENAARAEGFARAELVATMAGMPLYLACGYQRSSASQTTAAARRCRGPHGHGVMRGTSCSAPGSDS
jgi:hypothetical protein